MAKQRMKSGLGEKISEKRVPSRLLGCHSLQSGLFTDPHVLISSEFLWLDSSWDDDDEETRRDGVCWNFNGMPHKLQLRGV